MAANAKCEPTIQHTISDLNSANLRLNTTEQEILTELIAYRTLSPKPE